MNEPQCKIIVGIYLRGDDLDPEVVSRELGVVPSESQYRGERRTTPTGHEFTKKIGVWALLSDIDSQRLSDHLSQVVSMLRYCRKVLGAATGVQEGYVDVFIATSADDDGSATFEFDLTTEDLTALQRIGLPVRFTVTF